MPDPIITADSFGGIYTNVTPNAIKAGAAQDQKNMRSQIAGQLDVRGGLKPASFTNATTATTQSIIAIYQSPTPIGAVVIYETTDGAVRIGRTPSLS